jgi:hypothetical protein
MDVTQAHDEFAARMDLAERHASIPDRNSEQQREMLRIAEELQSCGHADIQQRALRVLAHSRYEAVMDLLQGFASNPNRKPEEYREMIPRAEQLLSCGYADIEQRAQQVIQELERRQNAKKWWQFWK